MLSGIVPIAEHHRIAARAEFARRAARHDAAFGIDDLDLDMRLNAADGGDAALQRIVARGLGADRAGLGHAIGDGDFAHVHSSMQRLITSIGQGEPAMMPVRSERKIETLELGVVQARR